MISRESHAANPEWVRGSGKHRVYRSLFLLIVLIIGLLLSFSTAFASDMDTLVDKLVKKGILTKEEAKEVKRQAKEENVPSWMKNIKFKGDFRLMFQWQNETDKPERTRGRIRLRLGVVKEINKKLEVGFGLATGDKNPRSTNVNLSDTFSSPDIRIDYAYCEYTPSTWLNIWGGKYKGIKKAVWMASDLLWDSDIRPEGLGLRLNYTTGPGMHLFANTGVWILDEQKGDSDPIMYVIQPGLTWSNLEGIQVKAAIAYYGFNVVQGHSLNHSSDSNTHLYTDSEGNNHLKYDYDSYAPSCEIGIMNTSSLIPYLALFGDYVHNTDPNTRNDGYLAGLKIGHKKVKNSRQWQFKYMYRHLEKDAWLDVFPDSDAFGGKTDVKGHEVTFDYGLGKHTSIGFDYYHMRGISGTSRKQNLSQVYFLTRF